VEEQLRNFVDACECLSLPFDESTDMVNVAQLCVFIRIPFEDMNSKEGLFIILSFIGHTRDEDISIAFVGFVRDKTAAVLLMLVTLPPKSSHFPTWKAPLLMTRF